jgi:hypothetical protein
MGTSSPERNFYGNIYRISSRNCSEIAGKFPEIFRNSLFGGKEAENVSTMRDLQNSRLFSSHFSAVYL